MYNLVATIRQGVKANTDAKTLNPKLALNCAGPYRLLAVGPVLFCRDPGRLASRW